MTQGGVGSMFNGDRVSLGNHKVLEMDSVTAAQQHAWLSATKLCTVNAEMGNFTLYIFYTVKLFKLCNMTPLM